MRTWLINCLTFSTFLDPPLEVNSRQGKGSERGERRERGTKSQIRGGGKSQWNSGGGPAILSWGGRDICARVPKFLVTPLLMGPVC